MHYLHFVICAISILLNAEKNMAAIHKLEDIVWLKTVVPEIRVRNLGFAGLCVKIGI